MVRTWLIFIFNTFPPLTDIMILCNETDMRVCINILTYGLTPECSVAFSYPMTCGCVSKRVTCLLTLSHLDFEPCDRRENEGFEHVKNHRAAKSHAYPSFWVLGNGLWREKRKCIHDAYASQTWTFAWEALCLHDERQCAWSKIWGFRAFNGFVPDFHP